MDYFAISTTVSIIAAIRQNESTPIMMRISEKSPLSKIGSFGDGVGGGI